MVEQRYNDFKGKVHSVMRGEGTLGQIVDVFVVLFILISVAAITLETIPDIQKSYGTALDALEIAITIVFTAEYAVRLWSSRDRIRHIFKPLYIIDLLAVLPFYITMFFPPSYSDLLFVRAIRVVRIFRVLKLTRYLAVVEGIKYVIATKKAELLSVVVVSLIFLFVMASLEYYTEPQTFKNIPNAMWWALVTLATVGYGDVRPETALGKVVASGIIYMSVAFIAVPTAIIGSSLTQYYFKPQTTLCPHCGSESSPRGSQFCCRCGKKV